MMPFIVACIYFAAGRDLVSFKTGTSAALTNKFLKNERKKILIIVVITVWSASEVSSQKSILFTALNRPQEVNA